MADFAPPTGPPPPKVPEGWKALWNDQYKEYFYVNIYTKKSQWDKPDSPVYPSGDGPDAPPGGPPPAYMDTGAKAGPEKTPFADSSAPGESSLTEDEKLARKLQDEENARGGGLPGSSSNRGEADSYYQNQYGQNQYGQSSGLNVPPGNDGRISPGAPSPSGEKRRSFLGKLFNKDKHQGQNQQYPPQGYPQQQYPQQGYYPPQGPPGYGGYGQAPYMQPGRRPGGGMGAGGAAALGLGGGLLGGVLLGEALDGGDHGGYGGDDGGGDGGDYGGDGGGDFGGGDFGGGDMGGGF